MMKPIGFAQRSDRRLRSPRKALIGIGAAAVLAVTISTPARAEVVDLLCSFEGYNQHVTVDTDRQSAVVTDSDGKSYGPYKVSISDTFFRWQGLFYNDWDYHYTIDRVAGTITYAGNKMRGDGVTQYSNNSGQCRRATQKF